MSEANLSETSAVGAHKSTGAEYISKEDAERDAKKLRDLWAARGFKVQTEVISFGFQYSARTTVWGFTSDMINGAPKDSVWRDGKLVPRNR